jgi:hypothetical protein
MTKKTQQQQRGPNPPCLELLPLVNAGAPVGRWLQHYWQKLRLPVAEAQRLAVTDDRREFYHWTGRRLKPLALGCYCYLPDAQEASGILISDTGAERATLTAPTHAPSRLQLALPGFETPADSPASVAPRAQPRVPSTDYRHLIFVEPDLLPLGIEVTVAHELIHLADRVSGNPRRHHCHGYDAISLDEARLTERDPEELRLLLQEETARREEALRSARPYRYLYKCPTCEKEYPRVYRFKHPVSCGRCDRKYNAAFLLKLHPFPGDDYHPASGEMAGEIHNSSSRP